MVKEKCKVNVYTEWDPLKEVIIGNCTGFNLSRLDAFFNFMYDNWEGDFQNRLGKNYELLQQYIAERGEDLDNIQRLLEGMGVVVRRPKGLETLYEVKGPNFDTVMTASDSPRDIFITYGNTIIETPPTNTKRLFESGLYRDIFMDYFRSGAQWIAAPRPTFAEGSFDFTFWEERLREPLDGLEQIEGQYDIAFDAANSLRFGKHILMNVGTKNHELGAIWLERTLRQLGYDVNVCAIRLTDSHVDWQLMPLAPGKMLVHDHYMSKKYDLLPEPLQKWDRIPIQDPPQPFDYPEGHFQMASSQGMDINGLSIDEKRFLIRDSAVRTAEALYKAGFEPIPVQLRHCMLFGDAIHCSSLDIRREGELVDYFND